MKQVPLEGDVCQLKLTAANPENLSASNAELCKLNFPKEFEFKIGEAHNQILYLAEEKLLQTQEGSSFTFNVQPSWLESFSTVADFNDSNLVNRNEAEVYRNESVREPLLNGSFARPRDLVLDQELEKCTPVTSCFPCVLHPVRPSTPEYEPTPIETEPPQIIDQSEGNQNLAVRSSATNLSGSSLHSSDASLCSVEKEGKHLITTQKSISLTVELLCILSRANPVQNLTLNERIDRATSLKALGTKAYRDGLHDLAFNKYSRAVKYCILATHSLQTQGNDAATRKQIEKLQSQCHLNMALTQKVAGNQQGVIENCSHALELDPNNAKAFYRRGKALFSTNQFSEAEKDLSKAVNLEPKNATLVKDLKAVRQKLKAADQQLSSGLTKMFRK